MSALLFRIIFILIIFICFTSYDIRAYFYCRSIFTPVQKRKHGIISTLAVGYLALSLTLFLSLPALISLIIVYFMVILLFLYSFQSRTMEFIFGSGTFMFHIMNVKMAVTSIFILIYGIPSYTAFRKSGFYLFCACVTVLLLLICLEIFQRTFDRRMIQTLIKTHSQLQFVTSSMMLINVYLLILSISYHEQAYSGLTGIFLLLTSLLLFGAFYTSFWHALKMSDMMEQEARSRRLEEQLKATKENVEELQNFAFTDTLTSVHNRRFGLEELDRLLHNHTPFCLCYLDIDHLKYVNDTFGHQEGDQYILNVVKVISGICRKEDTLSRMGGDEFMLLMPRIPHKTAKERMLEIQQGVSAIPSVYNPSISYGIVEAGDETQLNPTQILNRADQEMYQCKQGKISSFPGKRKPAPPVE